MKDVKSRSSISFYSKATSLIEVAQHLSTARVLPSVVFTVSEWSLNRPNIKDRVSKTLGTDIPLIVRSSSLCEDGWRYSNAGRFLSVPNVVGLDKLEIAVDDVVRSYGESRRAEDELLVQPMAQGLVASGVATTWGGASRLPYMVINVTQHQRVDAVTSGAVSCASSVYLAPNRPPANHPCSAIFDLLEELSSIAGNVPLDVEFGLDAQGVILLQIRRLTGFAPSGREAINARLNHHVERAVSVVERIREVAGQEPFGLGVMPDWNPAEMIGLKPRPLSYDLYAYLMTDRSWAIGRVPFGYRDMSHRRLMYKVAGTPYVDIVASASSLLPHRLDQSISRKVVSAAILQLKAKPHLHDKFELGVMPTCITPEMICGETWMGLPDLSTDERRELLCELGTVTRAVFQPRGAFARAMSAIVRYAPVVEAMNSTTTPNMEVLRLLCTARDGVATRFSLIARAAFVTTAVFRGLERIGAVRQGFFDQFVRATRTIAYDIRRDAHKAPRDQFLHRYGHVRPGTYDIRVASYGEAYHDYFRQNTDADWEIAQTEAFVPTHEERAKVEVVLRKMAVPMNCEEFLAFGRTAISGREQAKFVYSGFVSHCLNAIRQAGELRGFSRDDLSYLDLSNALQLVCNPTVDVNRLHDVVAKNRPDWDADACIRVPYLLFDSGQLRGFDEFVAQPNYVTDRVVVAPLVRIDGAAHVGVEECKGAIALMEAADPGHDWIFSAGIAGLVTAFGGENSHMAIRSREFDVPAVIGLGGRQFADLSTATVLILNCAERRIGVVR